MDAEPGEPDIWEAVIARAQMEADAGNLENWYGPTADSLLLEFGRRANATSRTRLLEEIHKAIQQAARLNYRKAQGDYRPDPDAKRFPAISEQTTPPRADSISFNSLIDAWRRSRVSAQASTVLEWERTIEDFKKFVGHDDAARVTKVNVRRWMDSLSEERGLTPRTGEEKKLAALRSTYRAAINKLLVHDHPTRGIVVDVPKRQVLRAKGFTEDEARRILIAALKAEKSAPTAGAVLPVAFRWYHGCVHIPARAEVRSPSFAAKTYCCKAIFRTLGSEHDGAAENEHPFSEKRQPSSPEVPITSVTMQRSLPFLRLASMNATMPFRS